MESNQNRTWRRISAKADRILPELLLPLRGGVGGGHARLRREDFTEVWVSSSPTGNASLRLVLRDKAKVKDFLGGFLAALVLAAAGELAEQRFDAIVVGAGKNKSWNETRSLDCPTAEQARNYLSDLVSDLLFGKNHYFLPIEAVEEVDKEIVARTRGRSARCNLRRARQRIHEAAVPTMARSEMLAALIRHLSKH